MDDGRCAGFVADRPSVEPCRTQVLVIRDFATTCACTCTCQHYYAIFMHSAYMCTCTRTRMHYIRLYTSLAYLLVCGYTRHLRTCWYAAIHVNRPSGISQAAAVAAAIFYIYFSKHKHFSISRILLSWK